MFQSQNQPSKAELLLQHEMRLREWDQRARALTQQLVDREKGLGARETQLEKREAKLQVQEGQLQQQRSQLDRMKHQLQQQHQVQFVQTQQLRDQEQQLQKREQQLRSCDPSNPLLDQQMGPRLEEATRALYMETEPTSAHRIRAVEALSRHLSSLKGMFGPNDHQLFQSLFALLHPSRPTQDRQRIAISYRRFYGQQRQLRGQRIAAQRTPSLLQTTDRPILARRHSYTTSPSKST